MVGVFFIVDGRVDLADLVLRNPLEFGQVHESGVV